MIQDRGSILRVVAAIGAVWGFLSPWRGLTLADAKSGQKGPPNDSRVIHDH
jgi:hypothetical protein